MGQRSQTFIHIPNCCKTFYKGMHLDNKERWRNRLPEYVKLMQQKTADEKAFGTGDNTVLSFHNQWLYGRSFLLAALNVLDFISSNKKQSDSNPFSYSDYYIGEPEKNIGKITSILSIFSDRQLIKYARAGYERFSLLNYEDPQIRTHMDRGDNNDGVLIIDSITNKYCFMNIGNADSTVMQLPAMIPQSAQQYLEAYYPAERTEMFMENAEYENLNESTISQELAYNIKINNIFIKRFKKYKTLSLEEVNAIFPEMNLVENHVEENVESTLQVV